MLSDGTAKLRGFDRTSIHVDFVDETYILMDIWWIVSISIFPTCMLIPNCISEIRLQNKSQAKRHSLVLMSTHLEWYV